MSDRQHEAEEQRVLKDFVKRAKQESIETEEVVVLKSIYSILVKINKGIDKMIGDK